MKNFFSPVAIHINSDGRNINDISVSTSSCYNGSNQVRKRRAHLHSQYFEAPWNECHVLTTAIFIINHSEYLLAPRATGALSILS